MSFQILGFEASFAWRSHFLGIHILLPVSLSHLLYLIVVNRDTKLIDCFETWHFPDVLGAQSVITTVVALLTAVRTSHFLSLVCSRFSGTHYR